MRIGELSNRLAVAQLRNDVPVVQAVCHRPPLQRPVAGGCLTAVLFASGAGKLLFVGRKNIDPEDHFAGFLIIDSIELALLESLGNDFFLGLDV